MKQVSKGKVRNSRPTVERLQKIVDAFCEVQISVVGDTVLDEFVYGEIARVSREAPVLILDHRRTDPIPGGAGNAAANLAALDVKTTLIGRIGSDAASRSLIALLDSCGIDVSSLVEDPSYETPTKTRVLAGSPHTAKQQIVRIDRGNACTPLRASLRKKILTRARRARRAGHGVLLADYGYGTVCPDLAADIRMGSGALTLDSRYALSRFRGVDAATPNLEELERSLGRRIDDDDLETLVESAATLRRRIGCGALLVTRGSRGMTLVEKGRKGAKHIPAFGGGEIADVTGAGDTVIAVFTAARSAGASWLEAAELANVAGGLVVMKRGTATITRKEILHALQDGAESFS